MLFELVVHQNQYLSQLIAPGDCKRSEAEEQLLQRIRQALKDGNWVPITAGCLGATLNQFNMEAFK